MKHEYHGGLKVGENFEQLLQISQVSRVAGLGFSCDYSVANIHLIQKANLAVGPSWYSGFMIPHSTCYPPSRMDVPCQKKKAARPRPDAPRVNRLRQFQMPHLSCRG